MLNQREQVMAAVRRLARERAADQVTLADVAEAAGVNASTVRRHVGSKAGLRELLAREQAAAGQVNPDTRTRILAAAARVFALSGYQSATLDQVAADAGMTKGAVYWHFASKGDLFMALMQESVRAQLLAVPGDAERVRAAQDREAAVSAWLAAELAANEAMPEGARLFLEFVTSSRDEAVRSQLCELIRSCTEAMTEEFRRMQKSQVVADDYDPAFLAAFLQALFNGFAIARLIDPERARAREWAGQLGRLLWRGLQPPASG